MNPFQSYLVKSALTFLLLLAITIAFNAAIDPFELFNSPHIDKLNKFKPEAHSHLRMVKANQIRYWQPDVVLIGSSRAEIGLDPSNPNLLQTGTPPYNLALSSINIYEVLRYLEHSQHVKPLRQVIIGLDFFMFNVNKPNEPDFNENRLAPNTSGWYWDLFQALMTYDGLQASLLTTQQQNKPPSTQYFPNGFQDDSKHWIKVKNAGGHRQATLNNESYPLSALDGFLFFSLTDANQGNPSFETFRKILLFCRQNQIDLELFISPEHARKLVQLNQVGLWSQFEHWKRQLVKLIAETTPNVGLWDFSGFNGITTEPFPEIKDKNTQMQYYWESSHYKKNTGDLVLAKMLAPVDSLRDVPSDFGIRINTGNIENWLLDMQQKRDQFLAQHPEIIQEMQQMLNATKEKRAKLFKQYPQLPILPYFQKS